MKKITQNWLGYAHRSYEQAKQSLLTRLPIFAPEITDLSENNPLIILVGMFAAIAEVLHLYIDAMAQEAYIGTARRYTSVVKIARQLDYRIKAAQSAYVDVVFTLYQAGVPIGAPSAITIPSGTVLKAGDVEFRTYATGTLAIGKKTTQLSARQYSDTINITMGSATGIALQSIQLPDDYAHKTLSLVISGDTYTEYDSFGLMLMDTKGFIVDEFEDGFMYLIFGDGINGKIPTTSATINATYRSTRGSDGNRAPGLVNVISSAITIPGGYTIGVNNPDYSNSGFGVEGLAEVRMNAPKCLAVQGRAVTYKDYKDLLSLAPGVGASEVSYCCADNITAYIAPLTRGIASQGLRDDTFAFMSDKKIMGRGLSVLPAGISRIWFHITVNGNSGFSETDIRSQVYNALDQDYGYDNSTVNPVIKPSDITNILEDLTSVDSLTINVISVEPYVRPSNTTDTPLSIAFLQPPVKAIAMITYKLTYDLATDKFLVYKSGLNIGTASFGVPFADGDIITFTITDTGLYEDGNSYTFKVHPSFPETTPANYTLTIKDNSIAIADVDYNTLVGGLPTFYGLLDVNLGTTLGSSKCKPSC